MKTANILKKKMVEIESAISSSASKMGEAAAIAEPPQIAVPKSIKMVKTRLILKNFPGIGRQKAIKIVKILIFKEDKPVVDLADGHGKT